MLEPAMSRAFPRIHKDADAGKLWFIWNLIQNMYLCSYSTHSADKLYTLSPMQEMQSFIVFSERLMTYDLDAEAVEYNHVIYKSCFMWDKQSLYFTVRFIDTIPQIWRHINFTINSLPHDNCMLPCMSYISSSFMMFLLSMLCGAKTRREAD